MLLLVIAGDIEPQHTRGMVSKFLKGFPKREGDIYRPQVKEPPFG